MRKGIKRALCIGLAGLLAIPGAMALDRRNTLTVNAARDNFSAVQEIRDRYMTSGADFRILEIVPSLEMGRIGYYIEGQEPFPCLYDPETYSFLSWQEKLQTLPLKEDRQNFMNTLQTEAEAVLASLSGSGEAPFSYEPYQEVPEGTPGAQMLVYGSEPQRGYFEYVGEQDDAASWSVIFTRLSSRDVLLSEINNGIEHVYYKPTSFTAYSYNEFKAMAEDDATKSYPIYQQVGGEYYDYIGTVEEVWGDIYNLSVSGNDVDDSLGYDSADMYDEEGDPTSASFRVIKGDGKLVDPDEPLDYGTVVFTIVNNNPDNRAVVGDYIYEALQQNATYVGNGGNYNLIPTEECFAAGDTYRMDQLVVYYTGGIFSKDVFRSQIMGLVEEGDPDYDEAVDSGTLSITVDVATPEMVSSMFYTENFAAMTEESLAIGKAYLRQFQVISIVGGADSKGVSYSGSNDLKAGVAEEIALYLYQTDLPVLLDIQDMLGWNGSAYYAKSAEDLNLHRFMHFAIMPSNYRSLFVNADETGMTGFGDLTIPALLRDHPDNLNVDTDHDLSFLVNSVWFYDASTRPFLKNGLLTDLEYISGGLLDGGFADVLLEIQTENEYRQSDETYSGPLLDEEHIYDATVFSYLLAYANRRAGFVKSYFHVLEIQPAYNASELTAQMVSIWSGVDQSAIEISTMQMNEFIGKLDDLNATYDMIYIGANLTGLNTQNTGTYWNPVNTTVYNDSSMNGLIYSHVGDLRLANMRLSGLLNDETSTSQNANGDVVVRHNGNDLTMDRYNALIGYLGASYPVVLSQDLLRKTGTGQNAVWSVNPSRVDNSSYLYTFIVNALTMEQCFVAGDLPSTTSDPADNRFRFYANRPKLTLSAVDYPNLITTVDYYNPNVTVIQPDAAGQYKIGFQFRLKNSSAASYSDDYCAELYVDTNADGKFSEINEKLSLTGVGCNANALRADGETVYNLENTLPSGYQGCITWKLVVYQAKNANVRAEYKGYTKLASETPAVIKILQIYPNTAGVDSGDYCIRLDRVIGQWNGSTTNPQYIGTTPYSGSDAYRYFHNNATAVLGDYILDITSVPRDNYNNNRVIGFNNSYGSYNIDDYDMLILGFSDAVGGTTTGDFNDGAAAWVLNFIRSGKSVLLAHDMISGNNNPGLDAGWSFSLNITQKIREDVGMDQYGLAAGILDGGSRYAILRQGINNLTVAGNLDQPTYHEDTMLYTWDQGYSQKDIAYTPGSSRTTSVRQTHGFSAETITYRPGYGNNYKNYRYRSGMNDDGITANGNMTEAIQAVNAGQITNYPFVISNGDELVGVKPTHNQYYTLDFYGDADHDGQTDMVVWYALTGSTSQVNDRRGQTVGTNYAASPGDVYNNYYIYNYGNVTYTGMGHWASRNNGSYNGSGANYANSVTEAEAKLFLNTMIAAYRAGTHMPDIFTDDGSGVNTDVFYSYWDEDFQTDISANQSTVRIYFDLMDYNIATQKRLEVKFFRGSDDPSGGDLNRLIDPSETNPNLQQYVDQDAYVSDITSDLLSQSQIHHVSDTGVDSVVSDLSNLQPNEKYYVDVPVSFFKAESGGYSSRVYITGRSIITKKTSGDDITNISRWAVKDVKYATIQLFDLD